MKISVPNHLNPNLISFDFLNYFLKNPRDATGVCMALNFILEDWEMEVPRKLVNTNPENPGLLSLNPEHLQPRHSTPLGSKNVENPSNFSF